MFNRRSLFKWLGGSLPVFGARGVTPLPASPVSGTPRIWDVHCHLTNVPGASPEDRMKEIVRFLDRMGIERVMLSLGYPLEYDPSPEQLRAENDQVLRAIKSAPDRAYAFVYLNPNHLKASIEEFDRCVRDGPMVGVKLLVARRCNSPELDPIADRAAGLKAPVLQHTWLKVRGNGPGESSPYDLVELAGRHPDASFICGHTGGDWELGIRIVRGSRNIFAEVAGSNPTAGFVEMAVRELGAGRVVYGSDAFGRSFASQLGKVMGAEIPHSAKRMILGENLRRILTPILRDKGDRLS
jgi:predicted TIM-barrel fold metal-dependent hydrolase